MLDGVQTRWGFMLRRAVPLLERHFDLRHLMYAFLTPSVTVTVGGDDFGFGAFYVQAGHPRVYLGGEPQKIKEFKGRTGDIFGHLLDTLAHELIHYEQWRDGKPLHHRGVERRAHRITNEVMDEMRLERKLRWQMTSR